MPTTTQYPNGQALVSSALTLAQMQAIIQALTLGMMGLTSIFAAVPHAGNAGLGYVVGDQVTVIQAGGVNGLLTVTTVGAGGAVTGLLPVNPNQSAGYAVSSGLATTGGTGNGLQVDISQIGPSTSTNLVRLEYPAQGAPMSNVTDDICYLRCVPEDDAYGKVRERITLPASGNFVTEQWNYTRSWRIHWTLYGPNSFDLGRAIKDALFMDYFTDQLSVSELFPVSDYPSLVRMPELINNQWFERVDYEASMYEFVSAQILDQTVASVEVIGRDNAGQIFDVTIT